MHLRFNRPGRGYALLPDHGGLQRCVRSLLFADLARDPQKRRFPLPSPIWINPIPNPFHSPGTKQTNQRLLKSLLLIISVNIGGYLISLSVYQLFYMLMGMGWDFVMVWHLSFISGISLNLSAACNAPILYWTRFLIEGGFEWKCHSPSFQHRVPESISPLWEPPSLLQVQHICWRRSNVCGEQSREFTS
jgi:hypothetical protein